MSTDLSIDNRLLLIAMRKAPVRGNCAKQQRREIAQQQLCLKLLKKEYSIVADDQKEQWLNEQEAKNRVQ